MNGNRAGWPFLDGHGANYGKGFRVRLAKRDRKPVFGYQRLGYSAKAAKALIRRNFKPSTGAQGRFGILQSPPLLEHIAELF